MHFIYFYTKCINRIWEFEIKCLNIIAHTRHSIEYGTSLHITITKPHIISPICTTSRPSLGYERDIAG